VPPRSRSFKVTGKIAFGQGRLMPNLVRFGLGMPEILANKSVADTHTQDTHTDTGLFII
jgi:hypothetical protein